MKKHIIASIVIIVVSSLVLGQNSRMGSASSTQLLVVPSAKHLSGGGAAATATGMDATFWNPAGLAMSENGVDAIFSNRQYFADIDNSFFGIATDIGDYKVGVSVRTFNIGDIDETTVFYPDGTGQVFTPNFSILGATFARKLSDNTSVGINANLIREGFGRVAATGVAYDLGVQYRGLLGREGLDVGFAMKNFGSPMKYDGEGLGVMASPVDGDRPVEYYKIDAAAFDLPFVFDMGVSYNIAGADIGVTYTSNYYSTDELKFSVGYALAGLGSVGVGMQSSAKSQEVEDTDDWYANPADGVSFGASIDMSRFVGMNMSVDYSMLPMGDFGTNSVVALRVAF
ncbi:MAG: PorV/PorQ family protein [Candidatus Neomarinimicrobiota bacterium]|nr:PorV/PorQ family protein [Candidatus Neomarinimicrobiota bacterium]MED5553630.1 PorV/PorQ family protein [Candidatus Neomarinimicrobiota bacterium]